MELFVIAYTVAAFLIIIMIFLKKGTEVDRLERRMKSINGKSSKQESVEELNDTFFNRFIKPVITKISDTFNRINEKETQGLKKNNTMKTIERQLRLAGMDMSAEAFTFYKQCFMAIAMIITVFVFIVVNIDMNMRLLILVGGMIIALLVPSYFLKFKASSRQEAIRVQVPDALDLLSVCIEAGLSFDSSLLKVSEKLEGPFIDELMIVYREIQMGVTRNDALRKLSDSTEIMELKTFISALIQATQLGIPINNVMAVQSEQLRDTRRQNAREKGAKAPVKILLPMVGLIFPVLFIILMGPTVVNIMDTLM